MEKKFLKEEIKTKVIEMVSDKFGIDIADIQLSSDFTANLGADSLDLVEMVMSVERAFGVSVEDSDAQRFKTVGDVVDYLDYNLNVQ